MAKKSLLGTMTVTGVTGLVVVVATWYITKRQQQATIDALAEINTELEEAVKNSVASADEAIKNEQSAFDQYERATERAVALEGRISELNTRLEETKETASKSFNDGMEAGDEAGYERGYKKGLEEGKKAGLKEAKKVSQPETSVKREKSAKAEKETA